MRKPWADAARGIAIITVVFFHVTLELARAGPVHWSAWALINVFAPFPMALFFLVAGHFSRTLLSGCGKARVGVRLVGLAYVFVVWSVLRWGALTLHGDAPQLRLLEYVVDPRTPLWFLWALIAYTGVAALIPIQHRWKAVMAASAVAVLSFTGVLAFDSFVYDNLLKFFPFFLLGLAAAHGDALLEQRRLLVLFSGGAIFAAASFLAARSSASQPVLGLLQAALSVLAVPVGVAGASVVASLPWLGRLFQGFGRTSLGVYLLHSVVLIAVTAFWSPEGATPPTSPWLPFVGTIAVLAVSLSLAWITQRLGWVWLYRPPRALLGNSERGGEQAVEAPAFRPADRNLQR